MNVGRNERTKEESDGRNDWAEKLKVRVKGQQMNKWAKCKVNECTNEKAKYWKKELMQKRRNEKGRTEWVEENELCIGIKEWTKDCANDITNGKAQERMSHLAKNT